MQLRTGVIGSALLLALFATGLSAQYTAPTYNNTGATGDYCASLTIGAWNQLMSDRANDFQYNTGVGPGTLNGGTQYTAAINQAGVTWGQGISIFIDYNQDGDYADAGEHVGFVYIAAQGTGNIIFTPPTTVPSGATRMRLLVVFNATTGPLVADGTFGFGQCDDFDVTISNGAGVNVQRNVTTTPVNVTNGSTVTVGQGTSVATLALRFTLTNGNTAATNTLTTTVTNSGNITGFTLAQWQGSGVSGTQISPSSGTFSTAGSHLVTLSVTDGGTPYIMSFTINVPAPSPPVLAGPTAPIVGSPILITECISDPPGSGDEYIELTNVSSAAVDITGWTIHFYDNGSTTPINYTLTGTAANIAGGDTFILCDWNGATNPPFDQYMGANLIWGGAAGGVMLRDNTGAIRDCVFFGTINPALITLPVAVGAEWSGTNPAVFGLNQSVQRTANGDTNTGADWTLSATGGTSVNVVNTGLSLPFPSGSGFMQLGGTDPNLTGDLVVGDDLEVTFSATDVDPGNTLTFTITVGGSSTLTGVQAGFNETFPYSPTGGLSPQSATLTGTAATIGTIVLNIQVSDGTLTDSYQLTITISAAPGDIDVQRPAATSLGSGTTAVDNLGNVPTTGMQFTYTIANAAPVGSGALNLTGTPIVDAPTANQVNCTVAVNLTGTANSLAQGATTTFTVTVTPLTANGFSYRLDIASNDADEPMYQVNANGIGILGNMPPVVSVGISNWVNAGGGLFTLTVNPAAAIADSLSVSDPEAGNMTVTVNSAPTFLTLTAQPATIGTATAGPLSLTWTGTADASNDPTLNYDWSITIDDGVSTPTTITARIIVVNTAPTHNIASATGGTGAPGTPYTAVYTASMNASDDVDLASVADQNTGQTLSVGSVTNGGANPVGGAGFAFTIAGGFLNVAPAGTLVAADVGTHTFAVQLTDGTNNVPISVSIAVAGAPNITTASPLATGTQGTPYAATIAATGGTGALTFSVSAGALPGGLSLSATGDITGTPTANGLFNFTVDVTDTLNVIDSQAFALTIDPPATGSPTITTTTLPGGTAGSAYGPATITATGGAGGFTFSVSTGTLPAGLTLSAAGVISGTPTTPGTSNFDVTVTDSAFATDTASLSITIVNSPTGGSGGGGGGGGGGGCETGSGGAPYILLAAAAAAIALLRRRKVAQ